MQKFLSFLLIFLLLLLETPALANSAGYQGPLTNGSAGTVTSVGFTDSTGFFTITGSPVTGSGTIDMSAKSGLTANQFLATPNGSAGAIGLRAILDADLPTILTGHTLTTATTSGVFTVGGTVVPSSAGGRDLGTAALPFGSLYVGGSATNNTQITGTVTGARVLTLPDGNSNTVRPDTGAANNFLTAISSTGVISKAQPAFSNLSGNATVAQGGTGLTSLTAFNVVIGNGTGNVALAAPGTTGIPLISQGAAANPAFGVAAIAGGGTNNGSLGVSALAVMTGDGTKVVQSPTGTALQQLRINAGGTGLEFYTASAGGFSLTITAKSADFTNSDATGTFYSVDATTAKVVTLDNTAANGTIHVFQRTAGASTITFNRSGSDVINYVGTTSNSKVITDGSVVWLLKTTAGWNVI